MSQEQNDLNTQDNKSFILNSISLVNTIIMIFYTFISDAEGLGVLVAIMVGPLLCMPQCVLWILGALKKSNLFIFKVILIMCSFIITIITISIVNYKINLFVVVNIILLIILLIDVLKKCNKRIYKKGE